MNDISSLSYHMTLYIDFQIGDANNCRFGCICYVQPAKHSSHAGHELAKADRLGDIVVGARFERSYHVVFRVAHRNHQDPDFGREGANFSASFYSADPRHIHIEKHQIKWMLREDLDTFFSAARLHDHKTTGGQRSAKYLAQGWFIIYHQYINWVRRGCHTLTPPRVDRGGRAGGRLPPSSRHRHLRWRRETDRNASFLM